MISSVARLFRRLWHDRSANVAMIMAICAIPTFAALGFAIDYGTALSNKSKLDNAADEAALVAIKTVQTVMQGGGTFASGQAQGIAQAQMAFAAGTGSLGFASVPSIAPTISKNGQVISATVRYSTSEATNLSKMIGIATIPINGAASSSLTLASYYQFIFVVDISGSTAIGGTAADITGLNNDSRIGCAFACHDPFHNRGPDYRAYAKADGWTLKIDYINSAIQNFITDLSNQTRNVPGVFSIGIDTFATSFNVLLQPTTDLTYAQITASTVDVEPMSLFSVSQGYTRTTTSLNAALAQLNNIGDGSSVNKQITYFIFLSDGVEDIEGNQIYGRGTDVTYTTACDTINQSNVKMFSILAPYPVVSDNQYPILVAPLASQLAPAMQRCASSPSMFYQANDGPGINAAVQGALQQILQGLARLTQ